MMAAHGCTCVRWNLRCAAAGLRCARTCAGSTGDGVAAAGAAAAADAAAVDFLVDMTSVQGGGEARSMSRR